MSRETAPPRSRAPGEARDRILDAAYELFSHHGIRAVGIDRIIAEAGVAKMTFYRHFPSKEDLVVAFLDLREQRWTMEWLKVEVERAGSTPRERVLGFLDAMDSWFREEDFESCSFIKTLLETFDDDDRVHQAAVRHLEVIRKMMAGYLEQAGVADPDDTAYQLQILIMGSIVSASRGDREAARRVRAVAELLVDRQQA
jgi:AcrR family transcriptional regulator